MKTTINSLIELATISNNKNRIELYKAMAQKLKNATKTRTKPSVETLLL